MKDQTHDRRYCLAFETSDTTSSMALGRGTEVLETRTLDEPMQHARLFLPTLAKLCKDFGVSPAHIRRIFVSVGPGSFTGLRVGIMTARIMGLCHDVDFIPVPTLEVIAQNALEADAVPQRVLVMLDAKRNHVYAGAFDRCDDGFAAICEPTEADPVGFWSTYHTPQGRSCAVLGNGTLRYEELLTDAGATLLNHALALPRAQVVYGLGTAIAERNGAIQRRDLVPTYVRPPEAEEQWARRQSRS